MDIAGGCNATEYIGNTKITMTGGKVRKIYGGGAALSGSACPHIGNAEITVSDGVVVDIFGGGNAGQSSPTTGNVTITMSGNPGTEGCTSDGTVTYVGRIYPASASNCYVAGNAVYNIFGGAIPWLVPEYSVSGTKTINFANNPQIGYLATSSAIINVTGALNGNDGDIKFVTNVEGLIATAANESYAVASKFAILDNSNAISKTLKAVKDGAAIKAAPITYKVVYDANAGGDTVTGTVSSQETQVGNPTYYAQRNTFVRTGYKFAKWNTTRDGIGGTDYPEDTTIPAQDGDTTLTLYAQWSPAAPTIGALSAQLGNHWQAFLQPISPERRIVEPVSDML